VKDKTLPADRMYTSSHGWLALAPNETLEDYPLRIGITAAALEGLDVSSLDLPQVGTTVEAGTACAVIRTSAQTALTMYAPISGRVTMTNIAVIQESRLVARDPYTAGWLFAVLPGPTSSIEDLLTAAQYVDELSELV
jgi:glycine cleavage system H protein